MAKQRSYESRLLESVNELLNAIVYDLDLDSSDQYEARIQILEACSSRLGGFSLASFQERFGVRPIAKSDFLLNAANKVLTRIDFLPIHPSLVLSALAREELDTHGQKVTGAYHTDFRLAEYLAAELVAEEFEAGPIIDPACGTGMLLCAATEVICGSDRTKAKEWLSHSVFAADLSESSLRGALLSLASFTDDLDCLSQMKEKWFCGDSLIAESRVWKSMAPDGFSGVIANPPWEKLTPSRHEFVKSKGIDRHYGADHSEDWDGSEYERHKQEVVSKAKLLQKKYPLAGNREIDLYSAFLSLSFDLLAPGGRLSILLPGGVIRSQGTESIRKKLFDDSPALRISIFHNHSRFFEIDGRFKFVALAASLSPTGKRPRQPLMLRHATAEENEVEVSSEARIGRQTLQRIRPDLTIPEIKTSKEWEIFCRLSLQAEPLNSEHSIWKPIVKRELDMTKERRHFQRRESPGSVPVIEGRMIQQYRFGAKGFIAGSGRRAIWQPFGLGDSRLKPQFWIHRDNIPESSRERTEAYRAGFCDIAGQTNERSLMASIIPPGAVCGNKVPTIIFRDDVDGLKARVWIAVANSFVFDWLLRRVLTTTVNYFLLYSIPFPHLVQGGLPWNRILQCSKKVQDLDFEGSSEDLLAKNAQLRAEIDAEVAVAYGLSFEELQLMLEDFPLLDRGYPALGEEPRSTVTRDTVLSATAARLGKSNQYWADRVIRANMKGAFGYIASEVIKNTKVSAKSNGEVCNE